jgi:hypothetical protein
MLNWASAQTSKVKDQRRKDDYSQQQIGDHNSTRYCSTGQAACCITWCGLYYLRVYLTYWVQGSNRIVGCSIMSNYYFISYFCNTDLQS